MKGKLSLIPREDLKKDEFLTSYNTKVMIGDQELIGVESVDVKYRIDDLVRAEVTMFTVDGGVMGAEPCIMMSNPETGKWSQVKKIEFTDGSEVTFDS